MKLVFKTARLLVMAVCLLALSLTQALAQTNRGKALPAERLPEALGQISPKDYFIPSPEKKVGVVHAMEGTVIVIHPSTKEGFFAAEGDPVFEKDSVATLVASKCRIRFQDENIVTMGPETEFNIDRFEDQRQEGRKTSFFSMAKGKAMFYALRLFRYKETRVTLKTPTTTIGVRGTKFGAHVYYLDGSKTASLPILVADAQNEIAPYLAQAGSGRSVTDCFSVDGVLDVDGRTVHPGQMYNGQTGQITPTPPGMINSFNQSTEINTGGTSGGTTGGTGGTTGQGSSQGSSQGGTGSGDPSSSPPGAGSGSGGVAPLGADLQANLTSIAQTQTGQQTEQANQQVIQSLPGPLYGYFSLLLQKNGSPYDAFMNGSYTRTDPHEPSVTAQLDGVIHTSDYIQMNNPSGVPDSGSANLSGGPEDSGGSFNALWTKNFLGQGTYTQWGYWEAAAGAAPGSPTSFDSTGGIYEFITNRVWFMEGNHASTSSDLANMTSGTYSYSGNAYGTYAGPDGSSPMSGSFKGNVNFPAAMMQDLIINVSGGGHSASLSQISPKSIVTETGGNTFQLDWTYLDAKIDGASSASTRSGVNGTLYGPKANEIGGSWGVVDSTTGKTATGVFQGKQQP